MLKPDFPENKEEWPFLWGENEYVIDIGASFILLFEIVNDLANEKWFLDMKMEVKMHDID